MRHVGRGPHAHGHCVTDLCTDAVDQPPEEQETDSVSGLEPEDDVSIAALGPAVELLQRGLQNAQDQPVDVAQDDRGEEQSADHPAQSGPLARCHRGGSGAHRRALPERAANSDRGTASPMKR